MRNKEIQCYTQQSLVSRDFVREKKKKCKRWKEGHLIIYQYYRVGKSYISVRMSEDQKNEGLEKMPERALKDYVLAL